MFSNKFSNLLNATSALTLASILLGPLLISPTQAMELDSVNSSIPQTSRPAVFKSEALSEEKQPLHNLPPTQTQSIFKSIMGNVPITQESLEDFLKQGACWLTYKDPEFRKMSSEKILMLNKIESENPNLIPAYSGSSYYVGALNDLFTSLYKKSNKMEARPDQYVFRSPEYFKSPYGSLTSVSTYKKLLTVSQTLLVHGKLIHIQGKNIWTEKQLLYY